MRRLSRREFAAVAVGATQALVCTTPSRAARPPDARLNNESTEESPRMTPASVSQPNIFILHVDQHRVDCLRCYGNSDIRTPNIDALAADGVRFANSFCPFPVCTPSRYSMLSGLYVHEHRGFSNHCTLAPDIETFPKMLRRAGYRTGAVGKMHFTPTYLDVGFERMILCEQDGPGRWDDDYHRDLRQHGLADINDLEDQRSEYRNKARAEYWETFGAMASNLPREYHSTEWIGTKALKFLDEWTKQGNLLMVGFVKPHHPFDPPHELAGLYDPAALSILPGWTPECFAHDLAQSKGYFPHQNLNESALRRIMAYYYAVIEHIDMQVGRMIDLLKRKGLYQETLIVFTGDHGEYLGFHHLLLKGGYMYEPLVRVPLIIKFPNRRRAADVSEEIVSNIDLAPTVLLQAGCRPAPCMRGMDLNLPTAGRDAAFAESGRRDEIMVRTQRYKLIQSDRKGGSLFFDLTRDPLEMGNRIDDPVCRNDLEELTTMLTAWRGMEPCPETYLDENAPVIGQPNVPARNDGHREEMMAYFAEKMGAR